MNTDTHPYTEADERYVTEQIGRTPQGVAGVAARDAEGRPAVITNHPLQRTGGRWLPFPTLYWLVDPCLHDEIAEAERTGGVKAIEAALQGDDELMQAHLADNTAYAKARFALLGKEDQRVADDQGLLGVLEHAGVGGVANHGSVKCLHAQYAYHLARHGTGTTVGRLMESRYGIQLDR